MGDNSGSTTVAAPPTASPDQNDLQQQQQHQQNGQQSWMYNNYGMYGMYPQYAQYYAYYNHLAQLQQYNSDQNKTESQPASSNAPPGFSNSVFVPSSNDSNKNSEHNPPLPPGPPPPMNNSFEQSSPGTLLSRPAYFHNNQQQQQQQQNNISNPFGPIRFNINNPAKRNLQQNAPNLMNPLSNGNTGTGGVGVEPTTMNSKKRRKRNKKNNQNQQNQQNQQLNKGLNQNNQTSHVFNNTNNFNAFPPAPLITPDLSKPPPPLPKNIQTNSPVQVQTGIIKKPDPFHNPTDAWPESLNNYVARCYAKCKTDFDKDQIDICLKGRITAAANKGELWTKDWDNEPVPSVHSERNSILVPKAPVAGLLNQYQNNTLSMKNNNLNKKGISDALGARLGNKANYKNLNLRKSKSRSRSPSTSSSKHSRRRTRSRSRSSSPPRKTRRSSSSRSSASDDDNYIRFNKSSGKNKLSDRLGDSGSKSQKKNKKQNKKKASFNTEFGMIGGEVVGDVKRLQQRAARFSDTTKKAQVSANNANTFNKNKKKFPTQSQLWVDDNVEDNLDLIDFHIVGTCRDLEKSFLRLTKAPSPSEVRPLEVLIFSLANVKNKWKEKQDYHYACDQLKSIRQDLTVCLLN